MSKALIREFRICEELGSGASGAVYSCQSRLTDGYFVVKSIDKRRPFFNSVKDESRILRLLSPHPNIIQLHKLYEDERHLHMVLDFCQNKDLYDLVACYGALKESEARCLFAQLMTAIYHCHEKGVIHRDIKPENILLDKRFRVKLADFGLAKAVKKGEKVMNGGEGSVCYRAPEVLLGNGYDEKVDVWGAGVVLYVMLMGCFPFDGQTNAEISEAILSKDLTFPDEDVTQSVSASVLNLLKRMLCKDPARRLSAEGVLRHPWFHLV